MTHTESKTNWTDTLRGIIKDAKRSSFTAVLQNEPSQQATTTYQLQTAKPLGHDESMPEYVHLDGNNQVDVMPLTMVQLMDSELAQQIAILFRVSVKRYVMSRSGVYGLFAFVGKNTNTPVNLLSGTIHAALLHDGRVVYGRRIVKEKRPYFKPFITPETSLKLVCGDIFDRATADKYTARMYRNLRNNFADTHQVPSFGKIVEYQHELRRKRADGTPATEFRYLLVLSPYGAYMLQKARTAASGKARLDKQIRLETTGTGMIICVDKSIDTVTRYVRDMVIDSDWQATQALSNERDKALVVQADNLPDLDKQLAGKVSHLLSILKADEKKEPQYPYPES